MGLDRTSILIRRKVMEPLTKYGEHEMHRQNRIAFNLLLNQELLAHISIDLEADLTDKKSS